LQKNGEGVPLAAKRFTASGGLGCESSFLLNGFH
jgi:hypothetical protein